MTRTPLLARTLAVSLAFAVAVAASACTAASPGGPRPERFRLTATTFHDINQNEFLFPADRFDEPYVMQVGFDVSVGVANSASTFLVEDYPHEICKAGDGQVRPFPLPDHPGPTSCAVPAAQGRVDLPAVPRLDVLDVLGRTAALHLVGAVTVAMEEDQLIPVGPLVQLRSIQDALELGLNEIAAAGNVPDTEAELKEFTRAIIREVVSYIGGRAIGFLAGFGNGDDRIGIGATVLVAAKGTLATLLRPALGNVTAATEVAGTSITARTGVLEPQTFSIDFHADAGVFDNIGGGDTDHRYDFSVTAV